MYVSFLKQTGETHLSLLLASSSEYTARGPIFFFPEISAGHQNPKWQNQSSEWSAPQEWVSNKLLVTMVFPISAFGDVLTVSQDFGSTLAQ